MCRWRGWLLLVAERKTSKSRSSSRQTETRTLLGNGYSLPRHEERKEVKKNRRRWGKGFGGELKVSAMVQPLPSDNVSLMGRRDVRWQLLGGALARQRAGPAETSIIAGTGLKHRPGGYGKLASQRRFGVRDLWKCFETSMDGIGQTTGVSFLIGQPRVTVTIVLLEPIVIPFATKEPTCTTCVHLQLQLRNVFTGTETCGDGSVLLVNCVGAIPFSACILCGAFSFDHEHRHAERTLQGSCLASEENVCL
ncbi:hypothetical protein B0H65DRAFT_70521 [Neurospora tetraspora]|uniref:Uncharacterized protein n=1 Tax=Neurospora tetraspora TaxID=94610 RepID=A0AAE0JRJ6_9PEZI|nr:hypothetical protein B0H65DRAFT_70521 [Neurospora tetraspora]